MGEMVMGKNELTERQRAFAQYCVQGLTHREAYRRAYKAGRMSEASCDAAASRVLSYVKVQRYLEELRAKAEDAAVMSRKRRMIYLSRVVETPPDKVDGGSDLCQEMVTSEFGVRCRMPDKIRAIQELNRMDGAYAPEEVKVTGELSFARLLEELEGGALVRERTPGGM